jgi:ABC-type transport system involved in multi-copper enzyme maturation permease subunit
MLILDIIEITQKRLWLNLTSTKLLLITTVMLTLLVGGGIIAHRHYLEQQELYKAAKLAHLFALEDARYYKAVKLGVERPPEPLSLLAQGSSERYGSSIVLSGKFAPMQIRARERLDAIGGWGETLDFSHLIGLFISLLALLTSYDAICGERQEGTLQLCLANALPRHRLLMGEYLGCLMSLTIPLLLAVLTTTIMLRLVGDFALTDEEVLRILLIFVGALLSTSALIWLGLCCSALTRSTTTAFIFAFSVWVILAAVYPNLALWSAQQLRPVPVTQETLSSEGIFGLALSVRREAAQETEQVLAQEREVALNTKLSQGELNASLKFLSPVSSFSCLAQILARTEVTSQRDLIARGRQLNEEFRQWQEEKLHRYPERESYYEPSWGPLDVQGLPDPQFQPVGLADSLNRALPYSGSLIMFNLIFSFFAFILLSRYDVRFS